MSRLAAWSDYWRAGDPPATKLLDGTPLTLAAEGSHAVDPAGKVYVRGYSRLGVCWTYPRFTDTDDKAADAITDLIAELDALAADLALANERAEKAEADRDGLREALREADAHLSFVSSRPDGNVPRARGVIDAALAVDAADKEGASLWAEDRGERETPWGTVTHLEIGRNDNAPIHDWHAMQRIKNETVGPERVAIEVFPAQSRLVDAEHHYHLWVLPEGFTLPFGIHRSDAADKDNGQTCDEACRDEGKCSGYCAGDGDAIAVPAPTDTLPCGHPLSAVVSADEGTNYCGDCAAAPTDTLAEAQALERRIAISRQSLDLIGEGDWTPQDARHITLADAAEALLTALTSVRVGSGDQGREET